jgi:hypothetical protein
MLQFPNNFGRGADSACYCSLARRGRCEPEDPRTTTADKVVAFSFNVKSIMPTHSSLILLIDMPSSQPSSASSSHCTSFTMPAEILRPTISKNNTPQLVTSQVRSKFLMRIGVVGTDPITSNHLCEMADCAAYSPRIPTRDLLQNVPRYTTELKFNRQDERKHMERRQQRSAASSANKNISSSASSPKNSKPKRCITFDESVNVVPIPMRHEYSDRIRSRLWSNAVELYENAGKSCKFTILITLA